MTKTAGFFCIGVFCLSLFSFVTQDVFAEESIGLTASNDGQSVVVRLGPEDGLIPLTPAENTHQPSVTFGELLAGSFTPSENENNAKETRKMAKISDLLAALQESSRQSLADFYANNRRVFDTPLPTPFIPIPTLLAGVSDILGAQTNTYPFPTKESLVNQPVPESVFLAADPVPTQQAIKDLGALSENPKKNAWTIALLGDSMTDTLGPDLYHLRTLLTKAYPDYTFKLINYGQGGTDMESGLYRLKNETTYLGEKKPPLLSYRPDIIVVESFAYNHWSGEKHDLDRQWITIAKIIDTIKKDLPDTKIILAATIAPNARTYGDGALNWNKNLKWDAALITKAYLQNLVNFATSQKYPLANAYHASLDSDGNGIDKYINQGDHLHPSGDGGWLYGQKIMEAIKDNQIIN